MPKLEVTLTVDKVTKNTIRYREVLHGTPEDYQMVVFPVIHLRNEAVQLLGGASAYPDHIKVTVEAV